MIDNERCNKRALPLTVITMRWNKRLPKVNCYFLNDRSDFFRDISHTCYLFIRA